MDDAAERARARFHEGDLAGAIEDARSVIASPSPSPCFVALVAVARGAWSAGLTAAEAALRVDANDALALWCRGEARVGLGDRAGALADWSKIVESAPTSRTTWKDRAILRALLGDHRGALEDLARVATLSPDDVVPHLWTAGFGGSSARLEAIATAEGAWTARLAGLVLGRVRAEDLLASAAGEDARRRCQVHGYAGLVAERDGDLARALRHYDACAATRVWHFVTHLWARERLVDERR